MVAVPITGTGQSTPMRTLAPVAPQTDWAQLVAATAVLAGGVLMVAGHKRAGIAAAAAGTALALLDEPETIEGWWKSLPGYLSEAQVFLDKVEGYLQEASTQGHRIQGMLRR